MNNESYIDTDAEEYFTELEDIKIQAREMFKEFKTINLEPAALTLSQEIHQTEHPLKQLYQHGRADTNDLNLQISVAFSDCISIKELVKQISEKLVNPEMRVFNEAYEHIDMSGDNGTFKDMLYLYYDVMKLYKRTRRLLEQLDQTATARIEQIY